MHALVAGVILRLLEVAAPADIILFLGALAAELPIISHVDIIALWNLKVAPLTVSVGECGTGVSHG